MAQSLKQINMNFQKAERAATHLIEAAHFLNRLSANENDYVQHLMKKNWTGENAGVFSMQNQRLFGEIDQLAVQIDMEARNILRKATNVKAAEERALAIALDNAQKQNTNE